MECTCFCLTKFPSPVTSQSEEERVVMEELPSKSEPGSIGPGERSGSTWPGHFSLPLVLHRRSGVDEQFRWHPKWISGNREARPGLK
jgi:hypothetical protein